MGLKLDYLEHNDPRNKLISVLFPKHKGKTSRFVTELKEGVCELYPTLRQRLFTLVILVSKWSPCAFGFSEQVNLRNEIAEQALASCIASLIPLC